jgi:hypothetical protein
LVKYLNILKNKAKVKSKSNLSENGGAVFCLQKKAFNLELLFVLVCCPLVKESRGKLAKQVRERESILSLAVIRFFILLF